jgi:hypothetical protein
MSKSTWTSPRKNAGQKLNYYSRDKMLGKRGRGVKNLSAMPSLVKNSSEVQRGAKRKRQRVGYRRNTLVKKKLTHHPLSLLMKITKRKTKRIVTVLRRNH